MTDSGQEGDLKSHLKSDLESQEWEWLSRRLVGTLHAESLSRFGGTPGMRDEGLLESALARPQHLARYEEPSTFRLASAYCEGIVNNHPFADGNKRAGLLAARVFLFKNGYRLEPEEAEMVAVVRQVAAGDLGREDLTGWIEANSEPAPDT
jgi:death-on-curing protein